MLQIIAKTQKLLVNIFFFQTDIVVILLQYSPDTSVSSTNKTDHHLITEILLKVALNTKSITLTLLQNTFDLNLPNTK